jgi:hypothetical protein
VDGGPPGTRGLLIMGGLHSPDESTCWMLRCIFFPPPILSITKSLSHFDKSSKLLSDFQRMGLKRKPLLRLANNRSSKAENEPPMKRQLCVSDFFGQPTSLGTEGSSPSYPASILPVAATVRKTYYKHKSDVSKAVDRDAIADYRQSLEAIDTEQQVIDYGKLPPGDQYEMKTIRSFNGVQRKVYFCLVALLRAYVTTWIGVDNFDNIDQLWVWNWPTWHQKILSLAGTASGTGQKLDCWFSSLSRDRGGHPKFPIRPGRVQIRKDASRAERNIWRFYACEGARIESTVARLVCILKFGQPANASLQASHLCHNVPATCFNPDHICFETDGYNKRRNKDANSHAMYCRHSVKCIFTNVCGVFLPHRNTMEFQACDCPGFDCHSEIIFVSEDGEQDNGTGDAVGPSHTVTVEVEQPNESRGEFDRV